MNSVRLEGKTVIVTGANTGIGLETARELANRGARVILACRNPERGERARADIVQTTGSNNVELKILDLSSFRSIREFAQDINQNVEKVDILCNNAGLFNRERELTQDGFEATFGVNHLGVFLLTYLLLDKIKSSAPARIVNVSSMVHEYNAKVPFNDLQSEKSFGLSTYNWSKTCSILHSVQLAKMLEGTGVTTYSLHPGAVDSELARDYDGNCCMKCCMRVILCCTCHPWLTTEEGAQTSLYCCLEPSIANHSGRYYDNKKEKKAKSYATDEKTAQQLWDVSMELCGLNSNSSSSQF